MAKFLYYSHLLALSFCHHAALLADQHKPALFVPGVQVEVLLKQTDRAIKYHKSLKLKLTEEVRRVSVLMFTSI